MVFLLSLKECCLRTYRAAKKSKSSLITDVDIIILKLFFVFFSVIVTYIMHVSDYFTTVRNQDFQI